MRIVGGEWGGRSLRIPRSGAIRPTADRVREAWMSIVLPDLDGASVVDLCAGTGALGLEALSRGARHAVLVEASARVLRTLRENVAALGAESRTTLVHGDTLKFLTTLRAGSFDVAFADPPYASGLAGKIAAHWLDVPFADVLGVEHSAREEMPAGGRTRRYGDSLITFYRVAASND